ncbi:MAG: Mu-like prophage major head subunit gpT family protein [Inquilinus sp.]|uniref:Mu-like prophage major head subunit gpT family protein n=1 Tax=Inquilinus sp. TaxID=1932117 RepID=UPI003F2DDB4B
MSARGLSSRAIIGSFYQRLEQGATGWVDLLSMYFNSDQPSEEYKWLGMSPAMRQWVGGRLAKGLREMGVVIPNLTFEATLEVLIDEMRRDKTGQVLVRINELADQTNSHFAMLLSGLINGGESNVCYDGQFFFDTDHQEGDGPVQSNVITFSLATDGAAVPAAERGTATNPGPRIVEMAILKGVQTMLGLKNDQAQPMNENARQFMAMFPIPFVTTALAATTATTLGAGNTNVLVAQREFGISPVPNPRLPWTDSLAVFRTDGNVKPFIRQEEVPVQMSAIAEGSELEFTHRKHQYGVYASRNVGYGYWQHAVKVKLAA